VAKILSDENFNINILAQYMHYLIRQNNVGQKRRNFLKVIKILSDENLSDILQKLVEKNERNFG